VELVRDGNQVAVVHGGGKTAAETLAMGKKSEFVNGAARDGCGDARCGADGAGGAVNKGWWRRWDALGQPAMGLSGGDGLMFRARKKRTVPDLGFVGEIAASDPRWIERSGS
jgi:acetylglutamate kinase